MILPRKADLLRWFGKPERLPGTYIANIDGASRGNPGRAAYGVVLHRPDGELLAELAKYIGHATNNVAEYYALIVALDAAIEHKLGKLRVRSDSELLVRQMQGHYKVKSPDLRPLHDRAVKLARSLDSFAIEHVSREQNARADELANEILDSTRGSVFRPTHSHARTIRARYRNGVLVPEVRLDLPDGQEVELTVRPRHTHSH